MRSEFETWAKTYPAATAWRDGTFDGHPAAEHVRVNVPRAIRTVLGVEADRYKIKGSAGQSEWTHTPWVAILDPAGATSVEEGIYVVYLMSRGNERLYLTLNQGCTALYREQRKVGARDELIRRAQVMRKRLEKRAARMKEGSMNLGAEGWRSELYEAGQILTREYDTLSLPNEAELNADLMEALTLYRIILQSGGWTPDDVLIEEARDEVGITELRQAKNYNLHRRIERNSSHSRKVKEKRGSICEACETDPATVYGELAQDMVDAHHLRPLSALAEGITVTFDVKKDFVVLCPSCHRAIHRMEDVSDLEGLKKLIASARAHPK